MHTRRPLVAANWKMHGSRAALTAWWQALVPQLDDAVEVVWCPPLPYLDAALRQVAGRIGVGAQNLAEADTGAYTGEVSASMLADCGASHVIVGHSERRALYGESDAVVAGKLRRALAAGLTPILCVGESLAEREAEQTTAVVSRQLSAAVEGLTVAELAHVVLAYEPVWAIGTGRTATPEQAQDVHALLRAQLRGLDAKVSDSAKILYGGSVKPGNAAALFAQADIDGGLIGGASLVATDFAAIVAAAGHRG
ncbi:MAG: triose-phosphate isomerase [Xanthomonadales bacterium]|jgi:triosephosphate isomerase|nr:triose-phosphate isomerase [Xanthomonadales bacterium]